MSGLSVCRSRVPPKPEFLSLKVRSPRARAARRPPGRIATAILGVDTYRSTYRRNSFEHRRLLSFINVDGKTCPCFVPGINASKRGVQRNAAIEDEGLARAAVAFDHNHESLFIGHFKVSL
jgi:hypothetical protein